MGENDGERVSYGSDLSGGGISISLDRGKLDRGTARYRVVSLAHGVKFNGLQMADINAKELKLTLLKKRKRMLI